jgi:carboxyl-terminal processing protease
MTFPRLSASLIICSLATGAAELSPEQRKLNVAAFEYAWTAVQKFMWEPMPAGINWQKIHDELLPKVEAAKTMEQARAPMQDMISRLKMTHFGIVPGDVYERLDATRGHRGTGGSPGFEIRLLEGEATVVSVEPDAPAYSAGIRPGWQILEVNGSVIKDLIANLRGAFPNSTIRDLLMTRSVAARFDGAPGDTTPALFLDGAGHRVKLDVIQKQPHGGPAKLGFLPTQHVWYESKKLDGAGYIRFNMFLDPARISTQFGDSVQSCMRCDGLIIDLRGNPGGLGGMSMGMAGWLIDKPNVQLGVMKTRDNELKFVINPRSEVFRGPVAILVDGMTGSTSEIFAGGLKDLGRARIFGTRTAGAALPSVFEKLPNGDGFQYAVANYISQGGKQLEGIGVAPDEEIRLTRETLLAGHDAVLEAALAWIHGQPKSRKDESKQ